MTDEFMAYGEGSSVSAITLAVMEDMEKWVNENVGNHKDCEKHDVIAYIRFLIDTRQDGRVDHPAAADARGTEAHGRSDAAGRGGRRAWAARRW